MTAGDEFTQWLDHHLYGTPVDYSTKQLIKDYAINMAGQYGADYVMGKMPAIIKAAAPHLPDWALKGGEAVGKAASWVGEKAGGVAKQLEEAVGIGEAAKQSYQEGRALAEPTEQAAIDRAQAAALKEAEAPTEIDPTTGKKVESARLEAIRRQTGATPESAARAGLPQYQQGPAIPGLPVAAEVSSPTQAAMMHHHELSGTYYNIQQAGMNSFKRQYDALLKDEILKPATDTSDVINQLRHEAGYAEAAVNPKVFNPETQRLLAVGKHIFDVEKTAADHKILAGPGNVVFDTALGIDKKIQLPDGNWVPAPTGATNVGKLLSYGRYAAKVASESRDEVSAKAASAIDDMVQESLKKSVGATKVAELGALDSKYRSWKLDFTRPVGRAIAASGNSLEAGNALFNDPQLMSRLGIEATPDERHILYKHFGDWMAENPERLLNMQPAEAIRYAEAMGRFAPKDDKIFTNPRSLMFVSGELNNVNPQVAPDAYRRMTNAFNEKANLLMTKSAATARDNGMAELRKLGPVGQRVMREVTAAQGNPMAQKDIIDKFFSTMTPTSLTRAIGQEQKWMGGGLVTKQFQPLPGEAAEGAGGPWMMKQMSRPGAALAYGAAGAMTGLAFGRPSMFYVMMAGGAAGLGGYRLYQKAILKALTSEYAPRVMSALANKSYDELGKVLAEAAERDITKGVAARLAAGATKRGFGNPLEGPANPAPVLGPDSPKPKWKEAPPHDFGPMTKDLARKQATAMSTERGKEDPTHIDQIEDLNKQVSKGSAPDIHQDLQSGRLAASEVRKLVESSGPSTPADMFKGMSIPDAIEAFAKGTPDEQSLGLPALAQKIQNEGQNLQPAQRRALMVQLRRAMGQAAPDQGLEQAAAPMPPPQGGPPPQQGQQPPAMA